MSGSFFHVFTKPLQTWSRIRYSLTADHCFNDGNVGKQPVPWTEYCADGTWENLGMCTGHGNITKLMLKMALNSVIWNCRHSLLSDCHCSKAFELVGWLYWGLMPL